MVGILLKRSGEDLVPLPAVVGGKDAGLPGESPPVAAVDIDKDETIGELNETLGILRDETCDGGIVTEHGLKFHILGIVALVDAVDAVIEIVTAGNDETIGSNKAHHLGM